jgi:hypothetical protein
MTKPTGRPRGRPKTKEYVTLMARFPQDLADRVERYAGRKRQTVSEVLRDGVLVLLQDDDPYLPFVSDRNTVSDMLSDATREEEEEAPPDAQSVIVSDMNEALQDHVSDGKGEIAPAAGTAEGSADILPDVKEGQSNIASDTKKARQRKRTKRDHVSDRNAETEKASDRKEDSPDILLDVKERETLLWRQTGKRTHPLWRLTAPRRSPLWRLTPMRKPAMYPRSPCSPQSLSLQTATL